MRLVAVAGLFLLQISAHAMPTDESLSVTMKNLMSAIQVTNQAQRVQQMCQLIRASVDLPTISDELLGSNFSTMDRDRAGISNFNQLMPSILVSQLYSLVSDKAGSPYHVNPAPLPKGSGRVGYNVMIGNSQLTVTISKRNNKILDAEAAGFSLVKVMRDEYQRDLQIFWDKDNFHSLPVSDLVKQLVNSGKLIRCN